MHYWLEVIRDPYEVPINYRDDGDDPRASVLDRLIARVTRKPASWCPGGWYDAEAPQCRECEVAYTYRAHNCQSICSCSCLRERLRKVHAAYEAERAHARPETIFEIHARLTGSACRGKE